MSETSTLFVGAGESLAAWTLTSPQAILDEQVVEFGDFRRAGELILVETAARIDAFDGSARRRWRCGVPPPYFREIAIDEESLVVTDRTNYPNVAVSRISLRDGSIVG